MKEKIIYEQTPTGWTNTFQDIAHTIKDRLKEGYECTRDLKSGNWICIKTNMEHTYIEQELIENYKKGDLIVCGVEEMARFIVSKVKKVRTETLMECRGLVGEDLQYDPSILKEYQYGVTAENKVKSDFRTAIDNLIKKETV